MPNPLLLYYILLVLQQFQFLRLCISKNQLPTLSLQLNGSSMTFAWGNVVRWGSTFSKRCPYSTHSRNYAGIMFKTLMKVCKRSSEKIRVEISQEGRIMVPH